MPNPQYFGFIVIMFGFLLQWPTLLTVVMFPMLLVTYTLLAQSEERDALVEFGDEYRRYMKRAPRFIPYIGARSAAAHSPT